MHATEKKLDKVFMKKSVTAVQVLQLQVTSELFEALSMPSADEVEGLYDFAEWKDAVIQQILLKLESLDYTEGSRLPEMMRSSLMVSKERRSAS